MPDLMGVYGSVRKRKTGLMDRPDVDSADVTGTAFDDRPWLGRQLGIGSSSQDLTPQPRRSLIDPNAETDAHWRYTQGSPWEASKGAQRAEAVLGAPGVNELLFMANFIGPGFKAIPKGYSINKSSPNNYRVMQGENEVGQAYVRDGGEKAQIGKVNIQPEHQRQGLGQALYGHIERDLGKDLVPDAFLTDAAHGFWSKHQPEAVAGYTKPDGYNGWYPPGQAPRPAVPAAERGNSAIAQQLAALEALMNPPAAMLPTPAPKPQGIRAYHGSPSGAISEFITPAFFSQREDIAKGYKYNSSGANLNGVGSPQRSVADNFAGLALELKGTKDDAIRHLDEMIASYRQTRSQSIMDRILRRPPDPLMSPESITYIVPELQKAQKLIDNMPDGKKLGHMYEAELSHPTKDFPDSVDQAADIRSAMRDGHKVVSFYKGDELVALDPSVIKILRKYGLAGLMAGGAATSAKPGDQQ